MSALAREPALADLLRRQIDAQGAMPLSRFMGACVSRYYAGPDPFGRAGDFITAPEISQMFGELLGLWVAVLWQAIGEPSSLLLVELGPGRGTLMADLLRAAGTLPGCAAALRVALVETSPALRRQQARALAGAAPVWQDSLDTLPPGPAIILANEFFDALPIDQYIRRDDAWHQRLVGWDGREFSLLDGPALAPEAAAALPPAQSGDIAEVSAAGRAVAATLGQRLAGQGGVALVIDYGHADSAVGDTLQAMRRHQAVPPLQAPGEVDLTAHVDFAALARAARPARASPVITQGAFLRRLGIELRTERLAAARPDQAAALRLGCQRLIDPAGMGSLFKVMALSSADPGGLPGFRA